MSTLLRLNIHFFMSLYYTIIIIILFCLQCLTSTTTNTLFKQQHVKSKHILHSEVFTDKIDINSISHPTIHTPHHHHEDGNNMNDSMNEMKMKEMEVHQKPPYPYALSPTYLIHLARLEMDIYKDIKNYTSTFEDELIKKYVRDYEESTIKGTSNIYGEENADFLYARAIEAASHPLIAYRMIRRFTHEFKDVIQHMEYGQYFESKLNSLMMTKYGVERISLPSKDDHEDGIESLLRLHYIYDLDLPKFARGRFGRDEEEESVNEKDTNTNGVELTTRQVFEIAEYAIQKKYFTLAKNWLDLTQSRIMNKWSEYRNESISNRVNEVELTNAVSRIIEMHDQKFDSSYDGSNDEDEKNEMFMFNSKLENYFHLNQTHPSPKISTVKDTLMKVLSQVNESIDDNNVGLKWWVKQSMKRETEHYTFLGLCNGNNYQSEEVKKKLTCWYDSTRSPYYGHINPLQIELLNKDPILIQIYGVIGDKWIAELIKIAIPTLEPAPTIKAGDSPTITYRTASYAWLSDDFIPSHIPISRRIELITNLNVKGELASEDLQIASYAYGAHVELHSDSFKVHPMNNWKIDVMGNRVTTFLIYLNDVEEGGYTAFPYLKTFVKPVKGSAVLWYTALKNGDADTRMLHGACPVILGHKWIATKWTNLNQNFLKRPCDLDAYL